MAKTDGSDLVVKGGDKGGLTIYDYIKANEVEFARALPAGLDTNRFVRIVLTAIRRNPQLAKCSVPSILAGAMTAAQLGLELNTPLGHSYLIPFREKGSLEAQFQVGYQGLLDLAWRSGQYKTIYAQKVYSNDTFRYQYGLNPDLIHVPADKPEGEPTHYYAVYQLTNGGSNFVVMSRDAVMQHAKRYSQAFRAGKGSPWQSDFDSMAMKTVLKQLLKYAPKSAEIVKAFASDEVIRHGIDADMTTLPPINVEMPEGAEDAIDGEVVNDEAQMTTPTQTPEETICEVFEGELGQEQEPEKEKEIAFELEG